MKERDRERVSQIREGSRKEARKEGWEERSHRRSTVCLDWADVPLQSPLAGGLDIWPADWPPSLYWQCEQIPQSRLKGRKWRVAQKIRLLLR